MSAEPNQPTAEPTETDSAELQHARSLLSTVEPALSAEAQAGLYSAIRQRSVHEDASWLGALRQQSTAVRRGLVLGVLALIVVSQVWLYVESAFSLAPMRVAASLVVFGVLMVSVLMISLRPLQQPALSRRAEVLWIGGALSAALALSVWPAGVSSGSFAEALHGALPCFVFGVVVALPVYAVARMFDRGTWISRLLAALAAGLAANFVLMTHCPAAAADHMLLGHFAVIAASVLGALAYARKTRVIRS